MEPLLKRGDFTEAIVLEYKCRNVLAEHFPRYRMIGTIYPMLWWKS